MAITYPTTLDDFTDPTTANKLNNPSHSQQHADLNAAVEALEAKVGVNSSAVTTSHDYKLSEVTSSDKAVGKTATQTLTNKTLTAPVISTISNTGTLTLPTSTDTLVGRATTDTLTNKTLTAPVISTIVNTGTLTLPTSTDTLVGRATTDTLTNKTLTAPTINNPTLNTNTISEFTAANGVTVDGVNLKDSTINTSAAVVALALAQSAVGMLGMINGKLSVTVASNNLTVAIKTLAGSDPSASDPVKIILDGTMRTITSALSVTKNAGTNWFNAGGSELATKETDYFVYLGYNATDGVVVGFARISHARQYSDFSTTTTNEKYAAISTITNAASTDPYMVVGRFAATLSAGAGYTWTVPTFTPSNLVQRPIYESRWLTWAPVLGGWSGTPTTIAQYRVQQERIQIYFAITAGVSNATTATATLPFVNGDGSNSVYIPARYADNSVVGTSPGIIRIDNGANTLAFFTNMNNGAWTATNNKLIYPLTIWQYKI